MLNCPLTAIFQVIRAEVTFQKKPMRLLPMELMPPVTAKLFQTSKLYEIKVALVHRLVCFQHTRRLLTVATSYIFLWTAILQVLVLI